MDESMESQDDDYDQLQNDLLIAANMGSLLLEENSALKEEVDQLRSDIATLQETNQELNITCNEYRKQVQKMRNEMNSLSLYAGDQEENVNRVNQTITQITANYNEKINKLLCDRDTLENETKELKSEISVIRNQYNEISSINEKLKSEIILLQSIPVQLEVDKSSIENYSDNNNIYQCNNCIKYNCEMKQLHDDLKKCKSELTNLQVENHKLITENMENKSYVLQYQDLINEMNKDVNETIDESIRRDSDVIDKDLLEEISLNGSFCLSTESTDTKNIQIQSLENQIKTMKSEIEEMKHEHQIELTNLKMLKEKELNRKIDEYNSKIYELEEKHSKELSDINEEHEKEKEEIEITHENEINNYEEEIINITNNINTEFALKMDEILKELEKEKNENEKLKEENEKLLKTKLSAATPSSLLNTECKECKKYKSIINELKIQLLKASTPPSTPPPQLTKSHSSIQSVPQLSRSISTLPSLSVSSRRLLSPSFTSRNSLESNSRNLVIFNLQEKVKRLKEELKEIQNRHNDEINTLSDSLNLLMESDIERIKFEYERRIETIENKHIRDINILNEYQENNMKIMMKEKDEEIKRLKMEIGNEIRNEIRNELKMKKDSLSKIFNFRKLNRNTVNNKNKNVKCDNEKIKEIEEKMNSLFV